MQTATVCVCAGLVIGATGFLPLLARESRLQTAVPPERAIGGVTAQCFGQSRTLYFHTSRGERIEISKSAPGTYFGTAAPNITWFTADGLLHSVVGSWEVECKPAG